jgi:hypothetical protein
MYNGCLYDSLLELKFVLSVEKEYMYLREPVIIGYDPIKCVSTNYLQERTRIYKPDFLIRSPEGGPALLIELKPTAWKNYYYQMRYEAIANSFISQRKLDWKYKILYSHEIILSRDQKLHFLELAKNKRAWSATLKMIKLDQKYNQKEVRYFSSTPNFRLHALSKKNYVEWVKYGRKSN